jgi:glycosyltransferase involved in cell wall biosynthesis
MTAPRVLYVSALQLHPTISGGTLRSFGLANALRHHGLEVRVHSVTGRRADYVARRGSSTQTWPAGTTEHVDRGLTSAMAWLTSYVVGLPPVSLTAGFRAAAAFPGEALMSPTLRASLRWSEVVVADSPYVATIFAAPSAAGKLHVLNTHNVEHHLVGESGSGRLWRELVRRLELRAAEQCDILVSCCAEDARFFEQHARVARTMVVPNGIDLGRFQGHEAGRASTRRDLGLAHDVKVFLFTGSQWGPNREAFDFLLRFAGRHGARLADQGIHILVVGQVAGEPVRMPGLTATGRVDRVEPYFAAADAGLNPILAGAGTNLKTCEFIAARLPLVTTPFGARGFRMEEGVTGFLFEGDALAATLTRVRRLFDDDPGRLRRVAGEAYARNEDLVDMNAATRRLACAVHESRAAGNVRCLP